MGIKVEFNPNLCLRAFGTEEREKEECLPERLEAGRLYRFLKKGQRNYWLEGEIPLMETRGNEQLSRPLASIRIIEAAHFFQDKQVYTRGVYEVLEVFDESDTEVKFESYKRV